jgi:Rrf2 family protein
LFERYCFRIEIFLELLIIFAYNKYMRISLKAEYAVRAVLDLALHAPTEGGTPASEVAQRTGVPETFLKAILRDLRKAGLITSKRGPEGGHWLARDPARLTIGAIVEVIDGPFSDSSAKARGGRTPVERCLSSLWSEVADAVNGVLAHVTLEDLRRRTGAPEAPDYTI